MPRHRRLSSAADKTAWLQAHRHLWRDMPYQRQNATVQDFLYTLRVGMTADGLYSPKTTHYDVEHSIHEQIERIRKAEDKSDS